MFCVETKTGDQDDDQDDGGKARQPQDASASAMNPSRWSSIEDLPDSLQKIEVPKEMDDELQKLLDRVMSYPFRGFFIYSLPSQLEHDYMWTPVERVPLLRFDSSIQ